jgi:hypothetical protein
MQYRSTYYLHCEVEVVAFTHNRKKAKVVYKNISPAERETSKTNNYNSNEYKQYLPTWIPTRKIVWFDDTSDRRVKIKNILNG